MIRQLGISLALCVAASVPALHAGERAADGPCMANDAADDLLAAAVSRIRGEQAVALRQNVELARETFYAQLESRVVVGEDNKPTKSGRILTLE